MQLGLWDVLVMTAVVGLFAWRVVVLVRHLRGRRTTGPEEAQPGHP
ncbi:MAG TPA: hypothetical protein VIG79_09220 [Lapillicoccus sp.]